MEASALSAPAGLHRRSVGRPLLRLRSDEQLVALFRAGDEDAFGLIHDRYRQRLFSYARQMLGGSRSDAEDVMQDVFLRAYRALRADERPVSLRAWLYRVAHNRCVDHLRRPVPAPADVVCVSRTPLLDPLVEAERREELRRLVADVRRLPAQQRSALLMREMDGLSYAELADALETSVPAVKSLLVRARIGLVEAIEARDADCADIRHDLAASYDRGVRASSRARRHLRDCGECTRYRAQLREVRRGFAALNPSPAPAGALAKLLGLGGASSGAAAGAGAAGTGTVAIGGGAAAVSVTKVAALVCCAAVLGGGTFAGVQQVAPAHRHSSSAHHRAAPAAGVVAATGRRARPVGQAVLTPPAPRHRAVVRRHGARLAPELLGDPAAGGPQDPSGGQPAPEDAAAPASSSAGDQPAQGPLSTLLGDETSQAPAGSTTGSASPSSNPSGTSSPSQPPSGSASASTASSGASSSSTSSSSTSSSSSSSPSSSASSGDGAGTGSSSRA